MATNLVFWVSAVYGESKHIAHMVEDLDKNFDAKCIDAPRPPPGWNVQREEVTGGTVGRLLQRAKRASDASGKTSCYNLSKGTEEFFFPFLIEFVLIGELSTFDGVKC